MTELWIVSLPILIVDIANPVLLAAVIYSLTSERPFAASLAVLVGHMVAYFLAGVLIVVGPVDVLARWLAPFIDWFNNPVAIDYVMGFFLGILLLTVSWKWKMAPPTPSENKTQAVSGGLIRAFGFGAVINFVGIPFALPYFAFINQLYKLDVEHKLTTLLFYNIAYAIPFLLVPLALTIFGRSAMPTLQLINQKVEKYATYILPAIIGLLGLAMVIDALLFFATGQGLI
jgi:hypothetical protein